MIFHCDKPFEYWMVCHNIEFLPTETASRDLKTKNNCQKFLVGCDVIFLSLV